MLSSQWGQQFPVNSQRRNKSANIQGKKFQSHTNYLSV